jgi:3-oxoacyl-(acyl-carrier-protein) synthase/malonyl CoA-acyl carrier protein transacylase
VTDGAATAIVGMAAMFPGAPDLGRYWSNIRSGIDAIADVPAARIDPVFFQGEAGLYCRRGGFIDDHAQFDPAAFGIMPHAAASAEPDQLLALGLAASALADAGYGADAHKPDRTGVILGRGGYLTAGLLRLTQHVRTAEQLGCSLRELLPGLPASKIEAIKHAFRAQLGAQSPEAAIGLVPNLAASRIANRLDLRGPAYTVDGACASSLLAIDHAQSELARGRCDLVIAGGVHVCHDITLWSVFNRLGALSRSGQIRPFDRRADGLLIGEGVGLLVLKRHADALRDGDRIYALIRGSGVSSDGRSAGLMTPSVQGQVLALEQAWREAGLDPASVGLIEAHGTATVAGDAAELQTLQAVFGRGEGEVVLGSVKSMIGHSMPAAGAAGVIKAALAIYHRTLPPTLHCAEPHAALTGTRFRTLSTAADWDGRVRRAGVNAFGFGGINAHVVLEQAGSEPARRPARAPSAPLLSVWAARDVPSLCAALDAGVLAGGEGPTRLALLDPTPARLARARKIVERGRRWQGQGEIWFSPHGLLDAGGKIAFVFPGIAVAFDPQLDDVGRHFGLCAPAWQGKTPLERHGGRLIAAGRLLDASLRRIGIRPDVIAGHSIGEWNGMIASGMISEQGVERFIAALAPGSLEVPDAVFAAVGCSAERARELTRGDERISISHDNCPHQAIVCGPEHAIDVLLGTLREQRILGRKLPFRSGFHSPAFAAHLSGPRQKTQALDLQPPHTPLWSATRAAPYPAEPEAVRALVIDHLIEPVRFRELILALYADGVDCFVQVGQGSLTGFIADTLGARPQVAVAAVSPRRGGLEQLRRVAIALHVEGARPDLAGLPGEVRTRASRKLWLGVPLIATPPGALPELTISPAAVQHSEIPDPLGARAGMPAIVAEFDANLRAIAEAQREVVAAFMQRRSASARQARTRRFPFEFSLARHPELLDHCFYRQPDGWPQLADRYPVVPMTMHLEVMLETALELVPELIPIAIERVRAYRWCVAEPAQEVEIEAHFDGQRHVEIRIGDYAAGRVVMGEQLPEAPLPRRAPLRQAGPSPVDARALYDERFMFHGPAYRGVTSIDALGDDGIRGRLCARAAKGALLDNAGQLMGFWVMQHFERDRLAFPARIERVALHGETPAPGAELDCTVFIESQSDTEVRANIQLTGADGRVVYDIQGWTDRRFDTDSVSWPLLRFPEQRLLSERRPGGYHHTIPRWRGAPSRELMARRYLDGRERDLWQSLPTARKTQWLLGRIGIKDAVRDWLWRNGHGACYPVEIAVHDDAIHDNPGSGRVRVEGPFDSALQVSFEASDEVAVTRVSREQA